MIVYCVMELTDHEYGCRSVESVWTTYDRAEEHIEELGQQNISMWTGENIHLYTINSYRVNE